jgi:hydrogenase/urease accessory protein HupE
MPSSLRTAVALVAVTALRGTVGAHPLAPVLLELRELGDDRVAVAWKTPFLHPRGTAPEPALPAACHALDQPTTDEEGAGLVTRWTARCGPLIGARVGIDGLSDPLAGVARVVLADGRVVQAVLSAREPSLSVPKRPRPWDVCRSYLRLGVEHILTGPDHLLFVFGLVLLAGTVRRVLGTVSAFTLGHSVTLSLAVLGLTAVPVHAVEVAIAASVLALAVELAREDHGAPTVMRHHPWVMAFGFGLLHGLGFAAALRQAGLPPGDVPLALFAFNTGIEVGQVAFVAVVLAIGRLLAPVGPALPPWVRRAPVYVMGTLAAFWWFERTAEWLG